MSIVKVKITEVVDSEQQKKYTATGPAGSEYENRSYYQHVGLSSIPREGDIGIVVDDGQNYTMIASTDKADDRPVLNNPGDTVLYSNASNYVKIVDGGDIEIANSSNLITLKANGDIELGSAALKKLMTEAMIAVYNAHVHPTTTPGSPTGVPAVLLSTALHATLKVSGQ